MSFFRRPKEADKANDKGPDHALPIASKPALASPSSSQPTIPHWWQKEGERTREVDRAIAQMLATDLMPFQTVEKKGFKNLVTTLEPKYALKLASHLKQI